MNKKIYITTLIISIASFISSLFFNAFSSTSGTTDSFTALLMGWILSFQSTANLAWFANLVLVCSWVMIVINNKIAVIVASLGLIIGLLPALSRNMAVDESGTLRGIISLDVGYWLWITSMVVILVGSLIVLTVRKN